MATAQGNASTRLSREDYKKQKELEELRKSGAAMPAVDEEGRMINPHIPHYISATPWYYNSTGPTLKHQSKKLFQERESQVDDISATRVVKRVNLTGTKFRKGACENCGAMTHKTKECLDRPRARNAKALNKTIGVDETVIDPTLDFDGKRDRWNNYDAKMYEKVYEFHERAEEARRIEKEKELEQKLREKEEKLQAKLKQMQERAENGEEGAAEDVSDIDTDEEIAGVDEELGDDGKGLGTSEGALKNARNLRVREDTAKYLRNLDPNSAYYDPKTRSMRENPYAPDDPRSLLFAGDNPLRQGGMAGDVAQLHRFAWEMSEQAGSDVNVMAQPSVIEAKYKEFIAKREEAKLMRKNVISEKYGGSAGMRVAKEYEEDQEAKGGDKHTSSDAGQEQDAFEGLSSKLASQRALKVVSDKAKVGGATEIYVEFDASGNVIGGQSSAPAKSKYPEDVLELNHSAIWGSYYDLDSRKWGYGCCRVTLRNSYCTCADAAAINVAETDGERKRKRESGDVE